MTKQDPVVRVAITALKRAIDCLERGDAYNNDEITLPDYFPNGVQDHVTKVNEAILRQHALLADGKPSVRLMQEAEDVLGHCALGVAHIAMGLPKGKLGLHIEQIAKDMHVGRKEECIAECKCEQETTGTTTDAGEG